MFRAGTFVHENYHYRRQLHHDCTSASDKWYYADYKTWVPQANSNPGEEVGLWVPNPRPRVYSTYANEALFYLSYALHANENTKQSLFDAAWDYGAERLTKHICDQSTIPSSILERL
jgi:hypothetical protein